MKPEHLIQIIMAIESETGKEISSVGLTEIGGQVNKIEFFESQGSINRVGISKVIDAINESKKHKTK